MDDAWATFDPAATPVTGGERKADALEAPVEGVAGTVSLVPGAVAPVLAGEVVLESPGAGERPTARSARIGSVRGALVQAGPLAVAGLVTNGANVVVTILLARLLTTRGYGALTQLNGLFLVVSMPGSAVIVAVVRRVTSWTASADTGPVQRWGRRVHRRGAAVVGALAAAAVAAGPSLARFLGQPHTIGLDAMVAAGAVWVLLCVDRGLLQANRRYRTLSANLVVEGGLRAAGVLVLAGVGLGVAGAAVGVLGAELVTAVHARRVADRAWTLPVGAPPAPAGGGARQAGGHVGDGPTAPAGGQQSRRILLVDLVAALVALATVAWLQNVDVIVVGRDAPGVAGAYAAVSVASKALVFGAIVLGGYLLPEAAIRWHRGGHALRELGATLLFLAAPAALLLLLAVGDPQLLLRVVFSSRYLGAEAAFASLVLAMVCLSVTVVLTMYLLAVGRRRVAAFLVAGAGAATAAVAAAHGAPVATARADLLVQVVLAAVVLADFAVAHRRRVR